MTYITTKVHTLKSYPTYQFYASADSATADTDGVFKICILETMRWIRSRLSGQADLPPEIDTPEPRDHALFTDDRIASFSCESGFQIEVVYIEEQGAWSFSSAGTISYPGTAQTGSLFVLIKAAPSSVNSVIDHSEA